jgi:hypothetical protein
LLILLSSCGFRIDECYSKLYVSFWEEVFRFSEAEAFLSLDRNRSSVTFSKLHSKRIPLIFHHERPRLYRLLDPENFIYLVSGIVKNIEKVGSEKYLNLILDRLRIVLQDNRIGILRGLWVRGPRGSLQP